MTRRVALPILVTILALLAAGCARQPMVGGTPSDLDRKYSTFAYIEEGDLVTFIVGTKAARYRDGYNYMPVEIAIANTGVRTLDLTRESFTLIDEDGTRYPAATPTELIEGYDFLDLDREALSEIGSLVFNKFAAFRQYPSKFSPTQGVGVVTFDTGSSNIVRDRVALPKFGYLIDYIYFPEPATGIKGHRFELFLESGSLEDPVFVKFEVK